jgi:hypothetical protein
MSDAPHDHNRHRRPHTPPMAAPFLEFDLTRELEQLHGEPDWTRTCANWRAAVEWPPGTRVTTCISSATQDIGPPLMNRPPSATSDFDGN